MNYQKDLVLPAGSFVRPIDVTYLPKHIKDSEAHEWFNPSTDVYCYTHFGMVILAKKDIRRV